MLVVTVRVDPTVQDHPQGDVKDSTVIGPLIPASARMEFAWDLPRNPLTDSLPSDHYLAEQIRLGFRLFTDAPEETSRFARNKMKCSDCHLNAGQREKSLPLVGVFGVYPEYNKRAGRLFSMEDRIVECFKRSMDAAGVDSLGNSSTINHGESVPTTDSKEVLAISSYISWLSAGYPVGRRIPWRGQNVIPSDKLIPIDHLDPKRGETIYMERCITCHGEDGQGVQIGDKKAGPLWGPDSWNDGAGAARIYTLAGMIKYPMPYLDPGSLTDEEAQQIAAFINSKPRPRYPFKEKDYLTEKVPPDAVYYKR